MRFQSMAELNAYHDAFYANQQKQMSYLLERQYIQQFVWQRFVYHRRQVSPHRRTKRYNAFGANYHLNRKS